MSAKVDLYNNAYGNYGEDVYRQVRLDTYGEDLGQTSWATSAESAEIPQLLGLTSNSYVLEVGCGSGRYALQLAETTGCNILGVDINSSGIATANQLAASRNVKQARFEHCDVSQKLAFADAAFDAVFSTDVLCHIPGRPALLAELFRVLKPGARLLFSDALIIGGTVTHVEIATRSSIGYYVFSPPGENERMLQQTGFPTCQRHRHQRRGRRHRQALARRPGEARGSSALDRRRGEFRRGSAFPEVRLRAHQREAAAAPALRCAET